MLARQSRIALHMALAAPTGLATGKPARHIAPLWRGWMHLAAMAVLTIMVAGVIAWIARRVL